jgi:hypothetical protein
MTPPQKRTNEIWGLLNTAVLQYCSTTVPLLRVLDIAAQSFEKLQAYVQVGASPPGQCCI